MHRLDYTLPTLPENLALDEALLEAVEAGELPEVLRFWRWPTYAVVLGANGCINIDVNREACAADGVPLARRSSGGGTVLLGPGCLLFSLVLSFTRHADLRAVNRSYAWILQQIAGALVPNVGTAGISDLVIGVRKFSGNAQHRKSATVLHHGTLLLDFDLAMIGRYLQRPEREPGYREGRTHDEFVRNLELGEAEVKSRLAEAWGADEVLMNWPSERTAQLTCEQYATAEWIERR